ncbi:glycosyltransferase family 2 protein [Paraflavitalea sp. CAU 1676]|uniref:glycosyltransferase family 2 protein n=1 Tax=Paraflavitalea sp. CAU 1676 TaxID=3032598 RepID=UPI0023DA6704|nr:glycosyltransferase family 2 protein [Paraflavitalea sp. CAU 1676]MDF2190577.1 glycosyltransferase family 2 protein [Paraflavitalea sp. CAU 1676]
MLKDSSVGILISTYNWPGALKTLLQSILRQTRVPDEILIADDGSTVATRKLIDWFRPLFKVPITYAWQEDKGFRKSLILNKVMKEATADYIIQVDGDIVLHPRFVEDHLQTRRESMFVQGSRVILTPATTANVLAGSVEHLHCLSRGVSNRFNAIRLPALSPMIRSNPYSSANIKACNLAFWRKDYIAINGYDNDFQGWGWEDCEFAARLINAGVLKRRLKLAAICYHLHHDYNSRFRIGENEQKYNETIQSKHAACSNGLKQTGWAVDKNVSAIS